MGFLRDYINFKNGKKRPNTVGVYPVYGGNGILSYADNYNAESCVSIGRVGAYCGSVFISEGKCWVSDNAIIAQPKENADLRYIYYLLKSLSLNSRSIGTGQPLLTQEILNRIPVDIPPKDYQIKISMMLTLLDDTIEENERINQNLEQQTQTLFKSWFIDFEPFGGNAPDDWTSITFGEIATIKTDTFSPTKNPEIIVEHYSIPAYDEKRYPIFEPSTNIKSNKYILTPMSVMISKLNPDTKRIWRPICISDTPISSTEFIVYEALEPTYRDFVYSVLDSAPFYHYLCAHTTGSTNSRQRTTPKTTLDFPLLLPNGAVIQKFCSIVSPMYDLIAKNIMENQSLAYTRDIILPKLMSGEMDVTSIDI